MAVEQHAELVDPVDDLFFVEDLALLLLLPLAAGHLVEREHGVIGWAVSVMAGRAIDDVSALAQRQIVGDRDRLVVRDQETVLRAGRRAP